MNEERFKIKCAVYILFIKDEKILLYRRINTGWQDGKYGVPGGHLEEGESIIEAAIRETKEESGLDVETQDLEFIHLSHRQLIPGQSVETNSDYLDIFFLAKNWKGEPYITEENKSDDLIWSDINQLPENTLGNLKSAIKNYKNNVQFSEITS